MSSHSMLGAYGSWADTLAGEGPNFLSFRHTHWTDLAAWRPAARQRFRERLAMPDTGGAAECRIERRYEYDGLQVEELSWQLPYGPRTEAVLLKPAGTQGPLPGVLALHDHGGHKFHGWQKITRTDDQQNVVNVDHQERAYGSAPWANRLARRGYAVLVPDAFAFGSRRVRIADVPPGIRDGLDEQESDDPQYIAAYNRWAGDHESIVAKSLFSAGTTWAGVWLAEDLHALDVLCGRDDVDGQRVGIGGLSGGGLRTVYLAGLDDRVRCAVCRRHDDNVAGFTAQQEPYAYVDDLCAAPGDRNGLPGHSGDAGAAADIGTEQHRGPVVHSFRDEAGRRDAAPTVREGRRGRPLPLRILWGEHKFDIAMQEDAFDWFDGWLAES